LKSEEVFDNVTESTAAEESGFRLIREGEEGGVRVWRGIATTWRTSSIQSHSSRGIRFSADSRRWGGRKRV